MTELLTVKEHLNELKKKIVQIVIAAIIIFFIGFTISETLILHLIQYFELELFVLAPLEFIKTQLMTALYITIALLIPFILIQTYIFSKPIMRERTKKKITIYFIYSLLLAIIGFLFGVLIFSRFSLSFFATLPVELTAFWGVYSAIMFIIVSGFAFALTTQLIIIIPLLVKAEIVDINTFKKSRAVVIILALAISAIVTSPDPITQVLMSVPMYICFEAGIIISMLQGKPPSREEIEKENLKGKPQKQNFK